MTHTIVKDRLEDVMLILEQIPEFENPPSTEEILDRISHKPHLILTAYSQDQVIGFKIGYERNGDLYSWLGAILPKYRRQGVAASLSAYQEEWARNYGYTRIWMKTRNQFPEMLILAINRDFKVIGFESRKEISQHRIVLAKSI